MDLLKMIVGQTEGAAPSDVRLAIDHIFEVTQMIGQPAAVGSVSPPAADAANSTLHI